jgi:hypothetical protein
MVEPKRRPLPFRAAGLCYSNERRIAIALRYRDEAEHGGGWWSIPLLKDKVLKTVAHEVAHLAHPNHSREFRELTAKLVAAI